ncbi:MAG: carboxypeptidase-like regulatory domain-containing protein, partial [Alistipes sp.]|nr:carboxypeptidase-like regulatory domain-containing protein [Alistipes sp.]
MVKIFKTSLLYGLMLLLGVLFPSGTAAQSQVTGTVKDENGAALAGVTVMVKGTATGAITMSDGRYAIKASGDDELEFSFIGYTSHSERVGVRSVIDVTLQEEAIMAEQVVVTAYAVQKKVNVTGSISSVKGTDLVSPPWPTSP